MCLYTLTFTIWSVGELVTLLTFLFVFYYMGLILVPEDSLGLILVPEDSLGLIFVPEDTSLLHGLSNDVLYGGHHASTVITIVIPKKKAVP